MLNYLFLEDNKVLGKVYLSKLSFGVIVASLVAGVYASVTDTSFLPYIFLLIGYLVIVFIAYLIVNSKRKTIREKTFHIINEVIPITEHDMAIRWDNTRILDIMASPVQPVDEETFHVLETALSANVQKPTKHRKWWVSDNVLSANKAIYARFNTSAHDAINKD